MVHHDTLLSTLNELTYPGLQVSLGTLDVIQSLTIDQDTIHITLASYVVLNAHRVQLENLLRAQVTTLAPNSTVVFEHQLVSYKPLLSRALRGISNVSHVIAVSSCKGGVGKSTIAVNLAFSLALEGAKVGLFDADVYGPSLPSMVALEDRHLRVDQDLLVPVTSHGVKLMSFGYARDPEMADNPAILRGPMVSQIINQLVMGTKWGDLDYLIIDMPPGTGDVQLTLSQSIPLTGALIVTTPQLVCMSDVQKGIDMFKSLHVPLLGLVENMSYFMCNSCDTKHYLFGKGAQKKLMMDYGFQDVFEIPLYKEISPEADRGRPMVIHSPNSPYADVMGSISAHVATAALKQQVSASDVPKVTHVQGRPLVLEWTGQPPVEFDLYSLRLLCPCAHCVNEFTGEKTLSPKQVPETISAVKVDVVGQYALGIQWSDGHSSLYSFDMLVEEMPS